MSLLSASTCGVSPVPLLLQESRTLRSNQPTIFIKKQQSFRKEPSFYMFAILKIMVLSGYLEKVIIALNWKINSYSFQR